MATPLWQTTTIPSQFDADFNKKYFAATIKHLTSPNLAHRRMGNVVNTKKGDWKATITTLLGNYGEVAEGIQEAPPLTPQKVVDMRARVKLVKGVLAVSRELLEDDESSGAGYVRSLMPKFAERGVKMLELDFVDTFINRGFTYDPLRDLRDGKALFSVNHPAGGSGLTYGNTPAQGSALSEQTLAQAIGYFASGIYDDAGDLTPMSPTEFDLYVHPDAVLYAQQLVKSTSSTVDYKNSGVINPVGTGNGIRINVVALPYQTRRKQWTLVPRGEESGLVILMRTPPGAPEKIVRQNPDQVQWQARMRYSMFSTDPRGIYSNPGE